MLILSFLLGLTLNWFCILATNSNDEVAVGVEQDINFEEFDYKDYDASDSKEEVTEGQEQNEFEYQNYDDGQDSNEEVTVGQKQDNSFQNESEINYQKYDAAHDSNKEVTVGQEQDKNFQNESEINFQIYDAAHEEVTKKEAIDPMDLCQGAPYFHRLSTRKTNCLNCFCMNTNSSCRISPSMKRPYLYKNSSKCISSENYHIKNETFNITKDFPKYTGDHITAYGGQIMIETDESNPINYIEIFMEGSNITLRRRRKNPATCSQIEVRAIENKWKVKTENRNRYDKWATRDQLMIVLSNIKTIRLKASINYILNDTIKIRDFVMTKANQEVSFSDKRRFATEVEICKCPKGRSGLSCEKCEPGYKIKITYANETFSTECLPETKSEIPANLRNTSFNKNKYYGIRFVLEFLTRHFFERKWTRKLEETNSLFSYRNTTI